MPSAVSHALAKMTSMAVSALKTMVINQVKEEFGIQSHQEGHPNGPSEQQLATHLKPHDEVPSWSQRQTRFEFSKPETIQLDNGDQLPDFSVVGCSADVIRMARNEPAPVIMLKPSLNPHQDRTQDIQNAIEKAHSFPVNTNGFRAIVQLQSGDYLVTGSGFVIRESGVGVVYHESCSVHRPLDHHPWSSDLWKGEKTHAHSMHMP